MGAFSLATHQLSPGWVATRGGDGTVSGVVTTAEASESELGTTVGTLVVGFVAKGVVISFSSSIGSVLAFVPVKITMFL